MAALDLKLTIGRTNILTWLKQVTVMKEIEMIETTQGKVYGKSFVICET